MFQLVSPVMAAGGLTSQKPTAVIVFKLQNIYLIPKLQGNRLSGFVCWLGNILRGRIYYSKITLQICMGTYKRYSSWQKQTAIVIAPFVFFCGKAEKKQQIKRFKMKVKSNFSPERRSVDTSQKQCCEIFMNADNDSVLCFPVLKTEVVICTSK